MRFINQFVTVLSLAILLSTTSTGFAARKNVWKCNIEFLAEGEGRRVLGWGDFNLTGSGEQSCTNIDLRRPNDEPTLEVRVESLEELKNISENISDSVHPRINVKFPVKLNLAGTSYFDIAMGYMKLKGIGKQIHYIKSLESLLGEYQSFKSIGSIGYGLGLWTGSKLNSETQSLDFNLAFAQGLGFNYGFSRITISMDES